VIPIEALKAKEGIAFLAGAAVCFGLSAVLLAGGIDRFLQEQAMRDAVAAYHRDDPTARTLLQELLKERPNDAGVRVMLGTYEIDRAQDEPDRIAVAERLFEDARALDGRPSASIGLAVCALRAAANKAKEGRVQAAALVDKLLSGLDTSSGDVVGLQAAIALMQGRYEQALQLTETPPTSISRDGLAAWHWNRATAGVLARRGAALEAGLLAYSLRRTPMASEADAAAPSGEAAKLLVMAYRVALADPGASPAKPDDVAARAELARRALAVRFSGSGLGGKGRFAPPGGDEGVVLNALGMALYRVGRFADAAQAFADAVRTPGNQKEPLFLLNLAEARFQQALGTDEEKDAQTRKNLFNSAGGAFRGVCDAVKGQEGREATRFMAATNSANAYLLAGDKAAALTVFSQYTEGMDAAQQARDLGVIFDWMNKSDRLVQYKKAISLNHPDRDEMEKRVRAAEAEQRR
jgi:tetratricopeptide (TPR) repeat protein